MRITVEQLEARHRIQAYGPEGITVADTLYSGAILLSADLLIGEWQGPGAASLDETSLTEALAMDPEVLVIGTGASHVPFPEMLSVALQSRGLGLEVMATGAACRTYNILLGEDRRVAALLYPIAS
jgi:uncharacterized protein